MSGVSFAHPIVLVALAACPLLLAGWLLATRRALNAAQAVSRTSPGGMPYGRATLLALTGALAVIAAAQPRWGTEPSRVPREGAQLMIVLDISRSMDARDIAPSRLEAAKSAIRATLGRLGGDQAGLVIFAGSARLRFPLTTDLAAAAQVVSSLETGVVLVEGGSSAASGLDVALAALSADSHAGRVVLLISDGEDLGRDPAEAATRFREAGVELLVVGTGTVTGAPIPVFDSRTRKFIDKPGPDGSPLISRLNEPFLRAMAAAAGGRYLGTDLNVVPGAVTSRLAVAARARIDERDLHVPIERYQWFAAAALAALVVASLADWAPRPRPRALALATVVTSVFILSACATRAHDLNEQGRAAYRNGDMARAVDLFYQAQAERPGDAVISLNLARALHQGERYEEAMQAARRSLLTGDEQTRERAFASLGHHQFALQQLPDALESFKQALLLVPGDGQARHDYEVVWRLLHPAVQPPPPDGQSGQPQPGQGDPQGQQPNQGQAPNAPPQPGTPGGTQAPPSTGLPGDPQTPEASERRLAEIDRDVRGILTEAGNEPTAEEALQILRLLAERSRIAAQRDAFRGGGAPNDY